MLRELDSKLEACNAAIGGGGAEAEMASGTRKSLLASVKARETTVIGVYRQVAVQFADLHDTPGRMEARGAVRKMVPFAESRAFFYWRLRRRLAEFDLRKQVRTLVDSMDGGVCNTLLLFCSCCFGVFFSVDSWVCTYGVRMALGGGAHVCGHWFGRSG